MYLKTKNILSFKTLIPHIIRVWLIFRATAVVLFSVAQTIWVYLLPFSIDTRAPLVGLAGLPFHLVKTSS